MYLQRKYECERQSREKANKCDVATRNARRVMTHNASSTYHFCYAAKGTFETVAASGWHRSSSSSLSRFAHVGGVTHCTNPIELNRELLESATESVTASETEMERRVKQSHVLCDANHPVRLTKRNVSKSNSRRERRTKHKQCGGQRLPRPGWRHHKQLANTTMGVSDLC